MSRKSDDFDGAVSNPEVSATSDRILLRESLINLHNAKEREAKERMQAEVMLAGIRALSSATHLDPFQALFEVLNEKLEADGVFVLTVEEGVGQVRASSETALEHLSWPIEGPLMRAAGGQVVLIGDCSRVRGLKLMKAVENGKITSAVCAGLNMSEGPGLLICTHPSRNHFGRISAQIMERLAPIAGQALVRLDAREREQQLLEQTRLQNEALRAEIEERKKAELKLKEAQEHLVQSEKLSSLGQLVAGVAHEINTPLGVAVTANSVAEERLAHLDDLVTKGTLRKSDLFKILGAAREASDMVKTNLARAAQLVQDFREVAVDRSTEQSRLLSLKGYVEQVVSSISPLYRGRPIEVEVRAEVDVEIELSPGPLAQVITNLVQNAVVHAFHDDESGTIRFNVSMANEWIELIYEDSGRGMSPGVQASAFEPFTTTRRGKGGSGLGLFIVHNIITGSLGGRISLESTKGEGTRLLMRWPRLRT